MYLNPFFEKAIRPMYSIENIITHPTSITLRNFNNLNGRSGRVSIENVTIERTINN